MRAAPDLTVYHCAGGTILIKGQPLGRTDGTAIAQARELFGFYSREALDCSRKADAEGARYCATRAIELERAVKNAVQWRRAA